jgi:hypothetical protein
MRTTNPTAMLTICLLIDCRIINAPFDHSDYPHTFAGVYGRMSENCLSRRRCPLWVQAALRVWARPHVGYLVGNDEMMRRIYGALHIVADDRCTEEKQ